MYKSKLILMLCITLLATSAFADNLIIGTGGETGNYYALGQDIVKYCQSSTSTNLTAVASKASVDNIDGMKVKRFSAGIVQEDVLQYMARQDDRGVNDNRMKVITGLHLETIYILVPKDFRPKKSDQSSWDTLMSRFASESSSTGPMDISLLDGQDVYATGGAAISAKALMYFANINFNVVDVAGAGMPVIHVGGQPYTPVSTLLESGKYTLISLDARALQRNAPFYIEANVNYNVGGKNYSAATVGVRALLIGKSFRNEERNVPMVELATCIEQNLADLADDPETNPNWQTAYEMGESQANWAEFPIEGKSSKKK